MKRTACLIAAMCTSMLLSCKKDITVELDANNLTGCPVATNCKMRFIEQADADNNGTQKAGPYRLFWAWQMYQSATSNLYIKAPMTGASFMLNGDDIRSGRVSLFRACPACTQIPYYVVGGLVKGINTTPDKTADQAKWLVEAKVFLATQEVPILRDTLYVKQYFYGGREPF